MQTPDLDEKLSLREKAGFACGDFASNLFFMAFTMYGLYFYTDVFGISAAFVGSLFLLARIWDAINDPMMGLVADRTRSKWGRFRPYLLWMAVPFGVIGFACFLVPDWSMGAKATYAAVTYVLFGMVYTAINLPYSGLMVVISPNSLERTKIAGFRFIGAHSGGLFVALCIPLLVQFFGAGNEQHGYRMTMGLVAGLGTIMFLVTFATSRERVEPPVGQSSSVLGDIADLLRNKPCFLLFLVGIFFLGSYAVHLAAVPFYFKYYVSGAYGLFGRQFQSHELIALFFTWGTICSLLGVLMTRHIVHLLGKTNAFSVLTILSSIFWFPQYHLGPESVSYLFIFEGLGAFFAGPTPAIIFAMYADSVDYSEMRTGRRSTGLVMSFSSLGMKTGWAIGGALGGWILAWSGYVANQEQTPEAIQGIRAMLGLIPAGMAVVAAVLMLLNPLTDQRMKTISKRLARIRRTAAARARQSV
ncbi:MAG: MFS transporter [Gammaproteobacteria bacterium]|nr:MFS transporter [Gammaproteobacteria bacterium]